MTSTAKKVGPFLVDNAAPFTMNDLRKIGPWHNEAGEPVFVDYDPAAGEWYETPRRVPQPNDPPYYYTSADKAKSRRATLKGMLTRRANKARLAARRAAI